MLAKYAEGDFVDFRQLRQSLLNNGVNLRCEAKIRLLVGFHLSHPLTHSSKLARAVGAPQGWGVAPNGIATL